MVAEKGRGRNRCRACWRPFARTRPRSWASSPRSSLRPPRINSGNQNVSGRAPSALRRGGGSGDESDLSPARTLPPITKPDTLLRRPASSKLERHRETKRDRETEREQAASGREQSKVQDRTEPAGGDAHAPPVVLEPSSMGVENKGHKHQVLLHSMAALARRSRSDGGSQVNVRAAVVTGESDSAVLSANVLPPAPCDEGVAVHKAASASFHTKALRTCQSSPRLVGKSSIRDAAVARGHDASGTEEALTRRAKSLMAAMPSDSTGGDESIMYAVALLRKLQQHACENASGEAAVQREEIDQILQGFSRALESVTSTWDERRVEDTMQKLFDTHSNVFDESMQNFFIQNFLHESESAKTFRTALRRTSMLRRCLMAMYKSEHSTGDNSTSDDKGIAARRWGEAVSRVMKQRRELSIEVCPEITNPEVVLAVKKEIGKVDSWDFDVFAIAAAVPGQTLCIIGNAILEQYDICCHFRTSKKHIQTLLRKVERRYHPHPYHNAEHAADVTQTLHHFLSIGNLGSLFNERTKCTALLAAIIHDVGHTSFSNNFHITVNDELAVQYVYRSPLEHMHCALAFRLMKDPECNILQGLTRIEQQEVRNLITDMVLATDNSVHSTYLAKLDNLVRRATDEGWKGADPEDDRLMLQMALHAADVSNPTKSLRMYLAWTERIKQEFYQQGDKERELLLPVSIGYDREHPIPLEKMQAGFIIGIVRPLVLSLSSLPSARLEHCRAQLDANLNHWQEEINRNQPPRPSEGEGDNSAQQAATQ